MPRRSETEEAEYRRLHQAAAAIPAYPEDRYRGRGIVTCASVRYLPHVWILVRSLRHHGCALPIELWHMADEVPPAMAGLLAAHGVVCRDAGKLVFNDAEHVRGSHGIKPYSVLESSFEEVLFLDADNSVVRDPTFLFETAEYLHHGAVFWEDGFDVSTAGVSRLYVAFGVGETSAGLGFESGQFLIDKRRQWTSLNIALHLNRRFQFYYPYTFGDKETFRFALDYSRAAFYLKRRPPGTWPGVVQRWTTGIHLEQDWIDGQRLFVHRIGKQKFALDWRQPRVWAATAPPALTRPWLEELAQPWPTIVPPEVDRFYQAERRGQLQDEPRQWLRQTGNAVWRVTLDTVRNALLPLLGLRWKTRTGLSVAILTVADWTSYNETFVNGEYELAFTQLLAALPADRSVAVVDVGAGAGYFAVRVMEVMSEAHREDYRICILEGRPSAHRSLGRRLPKDPRLTLHWTDAELESAGTIDLLKFDLHFSELPFIQQHTQLLRRTQVALFKVYPRDCDAGECERLLASLFPAHQVRNHRWGMTKLLLCWR